MNGSMEFMSALVAEGLRAFDAMGVAFRTQLGNSEFVLMVVTMAAVLVRVLVHMVVVLFFRMMVVLIMSAFGDVLKSYERCFQ